MDIRPFVHLAIEAAVDAGNEIMKIYNDFNGDIEYKSDHSPLTIADKNSHNTIKKYLEQTGIPILSEEGKEFPYEERKNWDLFWLIDPLDGTKEFIKRNDEFTVNIALIHNEAPIAGIVLLPVKKQLYIANVTVPTAFFCQLETLKEKPSIEFIHSRAIKLPDAHNENSYKVIASRSHMNEETENFIENLKKEHSNVEFISAGSSLKICLIAHGKADVYPRFGPTMEWDTAAGHAIILGAGKQILTPENEPLTYNKPNLLNSYFIVK